jgi:hypothetical protein
MVDLGYHIGIEILNRTMNIQEKIEETSSQFRELMTKFETQAKVDPELAPMSPGIASSK